MTVGLPLLHTSAGALLALLIGGHALADFALQTQRMSERKHSSFGVLLAHGAIVAAAQLVFLLPVWRLGWLALVIAATHLVIDWVRGRLERNDPGRLWRFLADQTAHLLVIFALWFWVTGWSGFPGRHGLIVPEATLVELGRGAVLLAAYLFIGHGGSAVVAGVLLRTGFEIKSAEQDGTAGPAPSMGKWIGILERILLLTLVLHGAWSAIGFVLAAKSVARFKELDDRRFGEYYLVGTLTSVLVAVGTGLAVRWLLGF
jgi:hypothetical protein